MTHVIITRMLYKDDNDFLKRLDLYKLYLLESLKGQTNRNFDIAVLCNRKHAPIIKELGLIPFFVGEDNFGQKDSTWHCKVKWEEIEGLDKYDIQSNIDSDDYVSDNYVEKIQDIVGKESNNKSLHIHFQPLLVDYSSGLIKKMRNVYDEKNGSAFCSLYQPNKNNYIYIGQDGHRRMQKYANKSIIIKEGYCFVGIHEDNDSTTINA